MPDATPKTFGFVLWPEPMERMHYGPEADAPKSGICDTGEGGLECWLIARAGRHYEAEARHVRDVCITGFVPAIIEFDAAPDAWLQQEWAAVQQELRRYEGGLTGRPGFHGPRSSAPMPVDAAVCIGATQCSLWDFRARDYWRPEPGDLTDEGRRFLAMMQHLYGADAVHVVMVLDT